MRSKFFRADLRTFILLDVPKENLSAFGGRVHSVQKLSAEIKEKDNL
jgi:hypothetical protein